MLNADNLEKLVGNLVKGLPPGIDQLGEDVRKSLATALQAGLARMDLVTREDFDVQAEVLSRALEKLHALEQRIQALEETGKKSD